MGYGIWDMGYGIWDMGYGIWDMGYGIIPNFDYRSSNKKSELRSQKPEA
jgi:hypothetical protein